MTEKHCSTECREELIEKINGCALKSGVWKFVTAIMTISVFVLGVGYSIHAGGNAKTEWQIQEAQNKINSNTVTIGKIGQQLENIKEGQVKLDSKLDSITAMLLKEIKRSR